MGENSNRLNANKIGDRKILEFDQKYTAESDGYVIASIGYTTNSNNQMIYIKINDATVTSTNSSAYNTKTCSVFVKKGMLFSVIKHSATTVETSAAFIPITNG